MIAEIVNMDAGALHDVNAPCPHCVEHDQHARGDRVKFRHLFFGDQTGTIHHLLNSTPLRAVVHVDHRLRNVFWSVPIEELSPLEPVPA